VLLCDCNAILGGFCDVAGHLNIARWLLG